MASPITISFTGDDYFGDFGDFQHGLTLRYLSLAAARTGKVG